MARRVAFFVLSAAAAVCLAFVSQTGWVDADGARLFTILAVASGIAAISVLGVIAVKDHLLERLAPLVRWVGRALIRTGQRMTEHRGDTRAAKAVSEDSEANWRRAALTFGTWLYRRDEWRGLSQEARVAEVAPAPYLRKRLNHLGLKDLTLEPRRDIGPEPWWQPPEHTLVAAGGTTATCSCGWSGEGHRFAEHAGMAPSASPWRPTSAKPVSNRGVQFPVGAPPALSGVPEVGREAFLKEMRVTYERTRVSLGNLHNAMWQLSQAQASGESEKRRYERRAQEWLNQAARYAKNYWHDHTLAERLRNVSESDVDETYVGPAWRADATRRVAYAQRWLQDHRPPSAKPEPKATD